MMKMEIKIVNDLVEHLTCIYENDSLLFPIPYRMVCVSVYDIVWMCVAVLLSWLV